MGSKKRIVGAEFKFTAAAGAGGMEKRLSGTAIKERVKREQLTMFADLRSKKKMQSVQRRSGKDRHDLLPSLVDRRVGGEIQILGIAMILGSLNQHT